MDFSIQAHPLFIEQLDGLSEQAKRILENRILLLKSNPYRNKRIHCRNLLLFWIRFQDDRKEKRLIYLVRKPDVVLICILDRDKEYKDLENHLTRAGF